jgi:hypothetical protein
MKTIFLKNWEHFTLYVVQCRNSVVRYILQYTMYCTYNRFILYLHLYLKYIHRFILFMMYLYYELFFIREYIYLEHIFLLVKKEFNSWTKNRRIHIKSMVSIFIIYYTVYLRYHIVPVCTRDNSFIGHLQGPFSV